jgi:hypothetical protein
MHTKLPKVRRAPCALLTLLLSLVFAATALADVSPSVRIRLAAPEDRLPEVGEVFAFDLELISGRDVAVTAPLLSTGRLPDGQMAWNLLSFPLPRAFALDAMAPQTFPVQLTCNDPTQPITISMQVDGRTVTQQFNLLPQAINSTSGGDETVMEPDSDKSGPPMLDVDIALPEPAPITRKNVRDRRQEHAKSALGRNIRVYGRFVYDRNSRNDSGEFIGDGSVMGADGVTVKVYDEDWDWDDLLASAIIGPSGHFDITFYYDDAEAPDIYLEFVAANNKVDLVYPSIWNVTYSWRTPVKEDFQGSVINYGTRRPSSQAHYAGLHVLATLTQSWRWLNSQGFGGIDDVIASWPDSDWPHYKAIWETIYIPSFRQWNEGTLAHEYGHHWSHEYSVLPDSEYCNVGGRADAPGEDCRHSDWCMESAGVALQEGFANWISAMVTRSFPGTYGFSALLRRDFESVKLCNWNDLNAFDPASKTHGFFSAFLQDLVDGDNEEDPNRLDWGRDTLTWPASRILQTQAQQDPETPLGLIWALRLAYPLESAGIWMAATNNRFELTDTTRPSTPTGLTSTSHLTQGDSPDNSVDLVWTPSTDDFSGVRVYRVRGSLNSPQPPSWGGVVVESTSATVTGLAAGTWWFTVDAVDRAGNISNGQATFGPVTIRNPIPADIRPHAGNTWPYAIVPRNTNDATDLSAPLPATLNGNSDTYINIRLQNYGEAATTPTLRLNYYEDGLLNWWSSITSLPGLGERSYRNLGPFPMRGGRHAVGVWADAFEQMAEVNEVDNLWSRQFVWSPQNMGNIWYTRPRPPYAWGGFEGGIFPSPNSDGFRHSTTVYYFIGAVMVADNLDADFDLAAYSPSIGPTSGFSFVTRRISSLRPAGSLDAIITSVAEMQDSQLDIGVLRYTDHHGGFRIRRLLSSSVTTGTPVAVSLTTAEPAILRHFWLPGGAPTNHGTVTVTVDPALGPVRLLVVPAGTPHASLTSGGHQAVTDANGFAKIDFTYSGNRQALFVWQDPVDVPAGASGAVTAVVWAGDRPADLLPLQTTGWFAPLVPTQGAPGTPGNTQLPWLLAGNATTTYINAQLRNDGAVAAPDFQSVVRLDGEPLVITYIGGLDGFTNRQFNYAFPYHVRGGRHTLSLHLDGADEVVEGNENNNTMGLQFSWSPLVLANGPAIARTAAPPDPLGGFAPAAAWAADPLWFNCDGMRLPPPAPSGEQGWWIAAASLPGAGVDVDLRLHVPFDGSLQGFRDPLAASVWSAGETDYVLVNLRSAQPLAFDVGVVGSPGTPPATGYQVQAVASTSLGGEPEGSYGPFSFGPSDIVALHEMRLGEGNLHVRLRALDANVNYGMTLHRAQLPYHSKSYAPGVVGQVWTEPAGADEVMYLTIPQDGRYCLVVWKVGASDQYQDGSYELIFGEGTTSTPGDNAANPVPKVTALGEVWPNPFNPNTQIAFELAAPSRVMLEIFDVRGKRVRRLAAEDLPAGRHQRAWDGRSDAGDGVASGTYFARLVADGVTETRKMLLVK